MSKTKEITTKQGNKYLLVKPNVRTVAKMLDGSKNKNGVILDEKIGDEILKKVVVEPKMDMNQFDDYVEFVEVIQKAMMFMQGQLVEEEEEGEQDGDNEGGSQE